MELSLTTIGLIGICLFLVLMFLQMPIAVSMLLSGFIGIWLIRGLPAALTATGFTLYRTPSAQQLSVIPLFLLMGVLAGYAGISKDAYYSMHKWLGHLPGGLAIATVAAGAAFGAVCGSNIAAAATFISSALPEMRKYNYGDELSLGCIISSGDLSILIPPSGAFVVYGFLTDISIGELFIAGMLPGLLMMVLFIVQIYIQCRLNPKLAPRASAVSWKERLIASKGLVSIVIVFIVVMGGIYSGILTTVESAAVGAFAVFIVGITKRQLTWKGFTNSLIEAGQVTAMVMFLIIGAMLFSSFTTTTEIPMTLTNFIAGLPLNRWAIMAALMLFYILAGTFMDEFAILIISLPIVFPIILGLGFDPVYFGVLCVLTIMIGSISPPFGIVIFAVYGMVRDVPMATLFRGCIPFLATMIFCLAILVAFPQISLFLRDLAFPYG